jgi:hypothetical protein
MVVLETEEERGDFFLLLQLRVFMRVRMKTGRMALQLLLLMLLLVMFLSIRMRRRLMVVVVSWMVLMAHHSSGCWMLEGFAIECL